MAAAYWGSVTARRASEWVRMYSISSAVALDRLVRDPVGHLGAEELGHGDLGDAVPPGIVEPRRAVHQMPRGLDLRGHLRHPMSQGLLVAQRAAEGVALLEVCAGVLERLGGSRERQ